MILLCSKMGRKSILKPVLTALLFIVACYASFNAFYYPNPGNLDSTLSMKNKPKKIIIIKSPVKVYMYDLPRRFTYGVIESYSAVRHQGPVNVHGSSALPKYPGNQYSAEWYLFADLKRPDRFVSVHGSGSPIERVLDPEKADLFYVPFFSSLSLVVNQIKSGSGHAVYSDEETQEGLVEWLEKQVYWKRNNGWDHIFVCEDPSALNKVVDRIKNGILLVSDFWRLRQDQGSLVKDVILPYSHRIRTFDGEVGVESRKSLIFFMGNRYRKEGGKIRDMLFQILEKEDDVIIKHGVQSIESRRIASQGMHTSKFCLHPAGDTPSACRLFDAIVSLCIPIIVSDYIELPFEDIINYRKIAIFVDTNTALKPGFLVNFLRNEVSSERIVEFQKEMKKVKHYFEYDDPNGTVNQIWRQVSQKLPLIKQMIHRERRRIKKYLAEPDCSCLCSNHTEAVINM